MKIRTFKTIALLIHLFLFLYNLFSFNNSQRAICSPSSCPSEWEDSCQGTFIISRKKGLYEDSKSCPWSSDTQFIWFPTLVTILISLKHFASAIKDKEITLLTVPMAVLSIFCLTWTSIRMVRDIRIGSQHYNDHVEKDYAYKLPSFCIIQLFSIIFWFGMAIWVIRIALQVSEGELKCLRWIFSADYDEDLEYDDLYDDREFELCPKRSKQSTIPPHQRFQNQPTDITLNTMNSFNSRGDYDPTSTIQDPVHA